MSKEEQEVRESLAPTPRPLPLLLRSPLPCRSEQISEWLLDGPLAIAFLLLCGVQIATWLPHYLTWPWFADHDVFATLALGWEHGQLPYRDLAGNNFPGTIYLFWILGKVFGWGRTVPLYALDAASVLIFGASLVIWSRRRFGRTLPGVVGWAVFLSYYLGLGFDRAAQRDWHGPFFLVEGLLLVDAFPGRFTFWFSAVTTAIAFAIRPQTVVFLPALLLALAHGMRREPGVSARRTARALVGWSLLVIVLVAVAFSPLWLAGVWDDFLRSLRVTFYGSRYNKTGTGSFFKQLLLQSLHLEYDLVPLGIVLLAPLADPGRRQVARVWLLAYLGAWLYKPLSPVPFPYLDHPITLLWAINIGILVELIASTRIAPPSLRLVAVLLAARLGVHAKPAMCSFDYARRGIEALRRGEDSDQSPLGMHLWVPVNPNETAYPWQDFRETVAYLRARTTPDTQVANLLHVVPALNGSIGRTTPLPAESLAWLGVRPEDEPAFAAGLEHASASSVVVWTPEKGKFVDLWSHFDQVRRLAPMIRKFYEPTARFGDVEVWRRKSGGKHDHPGPAS
jgi:hypothetical protein